MSGRQKAQSAKLFASGLGRLPQRGLGMPYTRTSRHASFSLSLVSRSACGGALR